MLRRLGSSLLLVTGALLVATATRVVMLAAIEVTTFPAISVGYLSPAYPLFLAFIALALPAAIEVLCVHSAPSASDAKRHPMTDAVRGESVNPK